MRPPSPARWRAFGSEATDLDVDFGARAPYLVSELLRRCACDCAGERVAADAVWSLPVGARIEAIAALAMESEDGKLAIALRCPHVDCREALEVEITREELREWCGTERDSVTVSIGGGEVTLRRPSGSDQRTWLAAAWPDATTARRAILASLVVGEAPAPFDEAAVAAMEEALARIDPLVGFSLETGCPACGRSAAHVLHLERHALTALRAQQERVFEGVARLAGHFHWTEAEVFALPAWRRARYLAHVDRAA